MPKSCKWGWRQMALRKEVFDNKHRFLINDTLIVEADVEVFDGIISRPVIVPTNTLLDDVWSLFRTGLHSDVRIRVDGTDIHVHKNILATRSPVFRAMFAHSMRESRESLIEIQDIKKEIVCLLLEYVYTGDIKSKITSFKQAAELFAASDKYGLDGLTLVCVPLIHQFLSPDNIIPALQLVSAHSSCSGSSCLEELVKNFASQNFQGFFQHLANKQ